MKTALEAESGAFKWVAAATGSQNAAGYQLATNLPAMSVGGFNGTDPSPTLAEFEADVAKRQIHYYISSGSGFGGGGSTTTSTSSQIESRMTKHFTAKTIGGVTVYDLTATPKA